MRDKGPANEALRNLPPIDRVIAALGDVPHRIAVAAARAAVDAARATIRTGAAVTEEEVIAAARSEVAGHQRERLSTVVNATGVLLHTNLGRAPLGEKQLEAVARVAGGYSNLEYDLAAGGRGDRYSHCANSIAAVTGAESALVTNNNAAAVLTALSALCRDREVVVSRGELVEIGGGFRIPEVLTRSGAKLVEVGTTNRTRLEDYASAITPDTAALLKVHPSNYSIVGFTEDVSATEMGRLARERGIPFIFDLGSGLLEGTGVVPVTEPLVGAAVEEADLVTFSGDKLLGGPQCGVVAGRADLVALVARDPLMRVVRPDKMTLAALEATLALYLSGRRGELPLWRMAEASLEDLERRARSIAGRTSGESKVGVVEVAGTTGGGSAPEARVPSCGLRVTCPGMTPDEIVRALRRSDPPVIAYVEDDTVLLDLRTVFENQDEIVVEALNALN